MTLIKKPKIRCGRAYKVVRLPDGLHQKIKDLASLGSVAATDLYEIFKRKSLIVLNDVCIVKNSLKRVGQVKTSLLMHVSF